ncbi:sigma-70 family RNA polymerase sigma factor [Planctomicrobium sp. SH661]|uniref:sigma-70 family RNA polymerase sigma factor n=1 Tax=Planctomicrobium sp. SH661 TaxID=3448124 RepID=UPI003F5B4E02
MSSVRPELEAAFRGDASSDAMPEESSDDRQREQFVCLVTSNYNSLYRFILSLVGNVHAADDLMQECCLLLWRKSGEFDLSSESSNLSFMRWSRRIAVNLVRNFHRLRRPQSLSWGDALISQMASVHTGAEELLELRKNALQDCLQKLSASDQELLHVCYGTGTTIDATADHLKRRPNSLYKKLRRIRRGLFDCVNKSLGLE